MPFCVVISRRSLTKEALKLWHTVLLSFEDLKNKKSKTHHRSYYCPGDNYFPTHFFLSQDWRKVEKTKLKKHSEEILAMIMDFTKQQEFFQNSVLLRRNWEPKNTQKHPKNPTDRYISHSNCPRNRAFQKKRLRVFLFPPNTGFSFSNFSHCPWFPQNKKVRFLTCIRTFFKNSCRPTKYFFAKLWKHPNAHFTNFLWIIRNFWTRNSHADYRG